MLPDSAVADTRAATCRLNYATHYRQPLHEFVIKQMIDDPCVLTVAHTWQTSVSIGPPNFVIEFLMFWRVPLDLEASVSDGVRPTSTYLDCPMCPFVALVQETLGPFDSYGFVRSLWTWKP